jgi:PAS domain S-box-containing protein
MFSDISIEKAEEQVKFQARLLDAVGQAVIATSIDGTITYWNQAAEKLYGWKREKVVGRNIMSVTPTASSREQAAEIMYCLRRGESWSGEFTVKKHDGTSFEVLITDTPVFDDDGNLVGIIGVSMDITEQKKAEEQLRKALQEKDDLMKELNHRVKNNLAMVSSLINLKEAADSGSVDLSDLRNQLRAIQYVHDKLSRTEGTLEMRVKDYIEDLLSFVFGSMAAKPVERHIEVQDLTVPEKIASPLGLIINEIATNAVKHGFVAEKPARFTVSLHEDTSGGDYLLTLSNTGRPFPEDVDLRNPATLGLQLVNALVDQLDGSIELERNPDTTFTIRFARSTCTS